jgi:hypothetical protein
LRPLFFFLPKKNKEKQFPENLENIVLFLCSIFSDVLFFPLKFLIFCDFKKKSGNILLNKMFYTDKGFFFSSWKTISQKIVENLSPKWYKSVNGGCSVGSLWEVEDNMEPTKLPTDKQKPSNGAIENWSKYLPFMFRSLVIDLRGSKYLFAITGPYPISLSHSHTHTHTHTHVYTIVTNI